MSSHLEDTYCLGGEGALQESDRVNATSDAMYHITQPALPPAVESTLSLAPAIADVGTGTGAWLLQMKVQYPNSSTLHGFDLTAEKFPAPETLPEGVRLEVHDVRTPFPEELQGKYDIVHTRFLHYALTKADWPLAVHHLASLLRPNGWLICEDTSCTFRTSIPASESYARLLRLDMAAGEAAGRDIFFMHRLPTLFHAAGLSNCDRTTFFSWDRPELIETITTLIMQMYESMVKGVIARGGVDGLRTEEDGEDVMRPVRREIKEGMRLGLGIRRVWGGKGT